MTETTKITRDQYLNALEIVDYYHRQESQQPVKNERTDIKLIDWFILYESRFSTRLKNTLYKYLDYSDVKDYKFGKYLIDVSWYNFRTIYLAGKHQFSEFENLRNEYFATLK